MDWAYLPIFSKWTGLKFVEIGKKKIEKFKKKTEMTVSKMKI
jgi:hypothetical protein